MSGYRLSSALALAVVVAFGSQAMAQDACPAGVDPTQSQALHAAAKDGGCKVHHSHGFELPDPDCTPGAVNPTVTQDVLQGGEFRTPCVRDKESTAHQKQSTYGEYDIPHPDHNTGQNQVCELDHLVSLELGGADTLDNIWPQCGPDEVTLKERYFKIKDGVENYLADEVKKGEMSLTDAQRGIAEDWTQYIDAAQSRSHGGHLHGRDYVPQ